MAGEISLQIKSKGTIDFLKFTSKELSRAWKPASFRLAQKFFTFHTKKKLRGGGDQNLRATRKGWLSAQRPGSPRFTSVKDSGSGAVLEMDFRGAVALTHQEGLRQRAKAGGYFVLPLPAARTTRGKVKLTAKKALERSQNLIKEGIRRRDLKTKRERKGILFPIKSGSRIFLAQRVGQRVVFLFHLQKTLSYKERLDYFESWGEYTPAAIDEFRRQVARIVGGIRSGRVR